PVIVGRAVKLAGLMAVPPRVVTVIRPVVAAAGRWAVIWWSESTLAPPSGVPLNLTAVTSVKPEPAIVTVMPAGPLPGLTMLIRGSTRNVPLLWPMPTGVVTSRWPVLASAGTTARTCVGDTKVGAVTTPPNETEVAPPRFDPLIVTTVPAAAEPGLKPETFGAGAWTARLCPYPAPIANTPERPLGTAHCPESPWPQPQATTVPSLLRARLWYCPAAIAV